MNEEAAHPRGCSGRPAPQACTHLLLAGPASQVAGVAAIQARPTAAGGARRHSLQWSPRQLLQTSLLPPHHCPGLPWPCMTYVWPPTFALTSCLRNPYYRCCYARKSQIHRGTLKSQVPRRRPGRRMRPSRGEVLSNRARRALAHAPRRAGGGPRGVLFADGWELKSSKWVGDVGGGLPRTQRGTARRDHKQRQGTHAGQGAGGGVISNKE